MSLFKINQLNTTNSPALELHIKKFVNGGGSIIKLAIGTNGTEIKNRVAPKLQRLCSLCDRRPREQSNKWKKSATPFFLRYFVREPVLFPRLLLLYLLFHISIFNCNFICIYRKMYNSIT